MTKIFAIKDIKQQTHYGQEEANGANNVKNCASV